MEDSEKKKMHAIYMTDSEFDLCMQVAGHRQFSAWVVRTVLAAARHEPPALGTIPGGVCGSSSVCYNTDAWTYNKASRIYVCDACVAASDSPWLFENRRKVVEAGLGQRDILIAAVVRAVDVLKAYDARQHS